MVFSTAATSSSPPSAPASVVLVLSPPPAVSMNRVGRRRTRNCACKHADGAGKRNGSKGEDACRLHETQTQAWAKRGREEERERGREEERKGEQREGLGSTRCNQRSLCRWCS
jgi:hypothetical protein